MTDLSTMICPKCGSPDWEEISAFGTFITGLGMIGCGLWLIIFIVGIPIIMMGLAMISISPFAKNAYQCKRCKKVWNYA